jgi:antitoxin component YwqK of YwqJK toxin-antitoxin module
MDAFNSFATLPFNDEEKIAVLGKQLSLKERVDINIHDMQDNLYLPPFDECLHDGLFINFFPDGMLKDSGYYKNGLREEVWIEYSTSGNVFTTGTYKNGKRIGGWKYYNANGSLLRIDEYNSRGVKVFSKNFL